MKKAIILFILPILLVACTGGGPTVSCTVTDNWQCCYGEESQFHWQKQCTTKITGKSCTNVPIYDHYSCSGIMIEYSELSDQGAGQVCQATTNIVQVGINECYRVGGCPHTGTMMTDPDTGEQISEFEYCVIHTRTGKLN